MVSDERLTVLLVDDIEEVRAAWRLALASHPRIAAIREATGGHDAVRQLILRGPFDIVVSDVLMPDGTGHELAAFVRRNFPATAVLLTSAESSSDDEHLCPGGMSYLDKTRTTHSRFGDMVCHLAGRPGSAPNFR